MTEDGLGLAYELAAEKLEGLKTDDDAPAEAAKEEVKA